MTITYLTLKFKTLHYILLFTLFIGTVHSELGDLEEALTCFKNAVKIERSENYLQSLGICLVQIHDYEDAYVCLAGVLYVIS